MAVFVDSCCVRSAPVLSVSPMSECLPTSVVILFSCSALISSALSSDDFDLASDGADAVDSVFFSTLHFEASASVSNVDADRMHGLPVASARPFVSAPIVDIVWLAAVAAAAADVPSFFKRIFSSHSSMPCL